MKLSSTAAYQIALLITNPRVQFELDHRPCKPLSISSKIGLNTSNLISCKCSLFINSHFSCHPSRRYIIPNIANIDVSLLAFKVYVNRRPICIDLCTLYKVLYSILDLNKYLVIK